MSAKAPLLDTVDFSKMAFSDPKTGNKDGKATIPMVFARRSENDRSDVKFQLCRPPRALLTPGASKKERDELLANLPYVRSGFHLKDDPQFEVKDGKRLVFVAVPPAIAEQMRGIDDRNIQAVVDNVEPWFRRGKLDPAMVRAQYNSIVTKYPTSHEVPDDQKDVVIRCKVVEGETEIVVQTGHGTTEVREGTHKDLLVNARIIPVFRVQGMYFRSVESGGIMVAKKILVLHSDNLASNIDFDLGDDMELDRIQDFVPPGTGVDFDPAASGDAPPAEGDGLGEAVPSLSEGTVVNAPPSWSTSDGDGPAVLY